MRTRFLLLVRVPIKTVIELWVVSKLNNFWTLRATVSFPLSQSF
jgi:hypothetical protein